MRRQRVPGARNHSTEVVVRESDHQDDHHQSTVATVRSRGTRRGWRRPMLAGTDAALRIDENTLSTAVRTLIHPRTARIVTLVGTMHIGEAGYFDELSDVVEGLAASGAQVHIEGISHRDDSMRSSERNSLATANSWAHPETVGVAAFLSVESQGAKLRLPEGARNIDLTDIELLRRVGWDNYRRLFAPPLAEPSPRRAGRLMRAAIGFQLRHPRGLHRLRSLRGRYRRMNRVVIGERSRIAFAAAVEALTYGDVVLVWGADHLPGLVHMFGLQDYHLRREEWFDACTV